MQMKRSTTITGTPIPKDKFPDQVYSEDDLSREEQKFLTMYMTHFLLQYMDSECKSAIEFPSGISYEVRVILHHICDKLGLGSITRGPKGKGSKKRVVVAPMQLHEERFKKARKGRDVVIHNALKQYKYKTFLPPQVTIQEQTYTVVEEEKVKHAQGIGFEASWEALIAANKEDMKENVSNNSPEKKPAAVPNDGKDYSLSTDEYQIYIAGENKNVVNKDAMDDDEEGEDGDLKVYSSEFINPRTSLNWGNEPDTEVMTPTEDAHIAEDHIQGDSDPDEEMEDEEDEEEAKTNNIDVANLDKLTLEDLKARPDKITTVTVVSVTHQSAEFSWEVPECNNSPITEYNVKCKEMDSDTMETSFKSFYKSEKNSVIVEDLKPNTWHTLDVRAVNEFGYCPLNSNIIGFCTTKMERGALFSWGDNSQAELWFNEEDTQSKIFDNDNHVAYGPLQVKIFSKIATSIVSWFGSTIATIFVTQPKNMIQAGIIFEEEDDSLAQDSKEEDKMFKSLPFQSMISEQVAKAQCGVSYFMALSVSGKVYTSGANSYGQLGHSHSPMDSTNTFQTVKELLFEDTSDRENDKSRKDFIVDIAAGYSHCIALSSKQQVYIWGEKTIFPPNRESEKCAGMWLQS